MFAVRAGGTELCCTLNYHFTTLNFLSATANVGCITMLGVTEFSAEPTKKNYGAAGDDNPERMPPGTERHDNHSG